MSTESSGAVKRTSRLAVFEHVVKKDKGKKRKKFYTNRHFDESSPSESELIIDELEDDYEEPVKKNKKKRPRLEPLNLVCEWNDCGQSYSNHEAFNRHLTDHIPVDLEEQTCQWNNCTWTGASTYMALQHISYHGYLTKLINIGNNVLERNNLPACLIPDESQFPSAPNGYECEWEFCSAQFCTYYDFLMHMKMHVKNNPSTTQGVEVIDCCWKGCKSKFTLLYKLCEHVRVHSKEKMIACPTCRVLFSTKTKFSDHRKRQLPTALQSYQCSQCLKLFPSERLLRDHMRSHINHYKCTMCDMTCPRPSILAKHIRYRHVKEKFFKCHLCAKTFVEELILKTHMLSHDKEKRMSCTMCDFRCRTPFCLERHYVVKHKQPPSQTYECHCCKEEFVRGTYLTKHLMKVHNYHWPSGHTRFRYRREKDGIFRLQTVRYESLEVTQEMIRSESLQTSQPNPQLSLHVTQPDQIVIMIDNNEEIADNIGAKNEKSNVLITLDDVDDQGNIVNSEVIESGGIVCENPDNDVIKVEINDKNLVGLMQVPSVDGVEN